MLEPSDAFWSAEAGGFSCVHHDSWMASEATTTAPITTTRIVAGSHVRSVRVRAEMATVQRNRAGTRGTFAHGRMDG